MAQKPTYKIKKPYAINILKGDLKYGDYLIYDEEKEILNKFYVSLNIDIYLNKENKHDFILSLEEAINGESKDIFKHIKSEVIHEGNLSLYQM